MNRRDFVKALGAVAAVFGAGSKASAEPPPKLYGMTSGALIGRTGSTMMVSWIAFNGCTNSNHCYNPALKVTRQHKAGCHALRLGCELECRSGCYPREETEAIYFVGRR